MEELKMIRRDYYCGDPAIPPETRAEYTERVLRIMDHGGAMAEENIELFGRKLTLLVPPKLDASNTVTVCTGYFDERTYGPVVYNADTGELACGYIGRDAFCDVIMALWVLREFYTTSRGVAHRDGELFNAGTIIGWLNYICHEQYTNSRSEDIWELYKFLPREIREEQNLTTTLDGCSNALGTLRYLVCAVKPEREMDRLLLHILSTMYPLHDIVMCLHKIREGEGDVFTKAASIKAILRTPAPHRYALDSRDIYGLFARASEKLPGEVAVKLVCEEFDFDYAALMAEIGEEACAAACPVEIQTTAFPPVNPIPTCAFLSREDDDRAFWWGMGSDVELSDDMEAWLDALGQEFREILQQVAMKDEEAIRKLVEELVRANSVFWRISCFRDYFYEALVNAGHPSYQAATMLLGRLIDRESGNLPECDPNSGKSIQNWRNSLARRRIKRYLAVLANKELRHRVFRF